jgi:hypothetical protein
MNLFAPHARPWRLPWILLLGWLLGHGCTPADPATPNLWRLTHLRTDSITLDTLTPWHGNHYHLYAQGKDTYLVLANRKANSLHIYDWQRKGGPIKVIKFATEGPDGVGKMESALVLGVDSILVLSPYSYTLNLTDSTGKVKRRYLFLRPAKTLDDNGNPSNGYSVLPRADANNDITKVGAKVYLAGHPNLDYTSNQPLYLRDSKLMVELDLQTGVVDYHSGFPKDYLDRGFFPIAYVSRFSRTYNPHSGLFAWAFPASPWVQVADAKGRVLAQHGAKAAGAEEISLLSRNSDNDIIIERAHTDKSPSYGKLIYDPYRRLYLRFVNQLNREYDPDGKLGLPHTTQLLVLDEQFKPVGTFGLPAHHAYHYCFPVPEGWLMETWIKSDSEEVRYWATYKIEPISPAQP